MFVGDDGGYDGYGEFGWSLKKAISSAVKVVTKPVSKVVAQVVRTPVIGAVAKPIVKAAGQVEKSVIRPVAQTVGKAGAVGMAMATGGLSLIAKPVMGLMAKKPSVTQTSADAPPIYQDANGNVISKAEYDAIMAQQAAGGNVQYTDDKGNPISKEEYDRRSAEYAASGGNQYVDENGNPISKAQYDAIIASYATQASQSQSVQHIPPPSVDWGVTPQVQASGDRWVTKSMPGGSSGGGGPIQTQQDTVADDGSEGGPSAMQTAPVDVSKGDILDQQVAATLLDIKNRKAAGQPLTDKEKDFVDFMAKATLPTAAVPLAGFGFSPIWQTSRGREPLNYGDTNLRLWSEPEPESDEEEEPGRSGVVGLDMPISEAPLPSFNANKPGSFSRNENFEGMEEWRRI